MTLYEIDRQIMQLVYPETGEIMDFEALDELQMAREQKIENIALAYKNMAAEAAAIRDEEISLSKRRKALENRADRLKDYLSYALQGQKFQTARCAVTFRSSASVAFSDEEATVEWAQRNDRDDLLKYTAPSVSKAELMRELKSGAEIPGAELVYKTSVGVK